MTLDSIRQAAAEILAYTVRDIVPGTIFVKGEKTDTGFYFDFIFKEKLDEAMIPLIEERMRLHIKKGLTLKPIEMMRENAAALFEHHGQPMQATLVLGAESLIVPICQIDTFYDYCPTPYLLNASLLKAFKILQIKEEDGITRITGTAHYDKDSLKKFLKKLIESEKIDYMKLGREKKLFLLEKDPVWLPKGMLVWEKVVDWWRQEHRIQGFLPVRASSHREVFKYLNPKLPAKYAQIDTHDKATIFCSEEQLAEEINNSLQFIVKTSNILGFGNQWYLVTPHNRDKAIEPLVEGLKKNGIEYTLIERKTVKSPVIEVKWVDFLGREWLGSTLSLTLQSPVVIRRSVFVSLERCIALLVEYYALTKEDVAESFEQ